MKTQRTHKVNLRVSEEEWEILSKCASDQNVSVCAVINQLIADQMHPALYLPDLYTSNETAPSVRHRVNLSLTGAEYARLEENASMHGYPVKEYLKHVAMYGSIFLRPTISTFDLSSFMEGVSGAYAAYTAALVRLCEEKVLTEEQYAHLSQLLEEILKTSSDLQKEIYRNRKIVRKAVIKETLAMIKKEYLYQKVSLMVKNKESI
ncbi:MAG: hypothetical protein K5853_02360 [Lachnospiraceae bacterium]|nr:hypothetical protein [Lachnospiraceae bacterium]